jgi:hypothetical protein
MSNSLKSNARSFHFLKFWNKNYKWATLALISIIHIFWWGVFGMTLFYSDSLVAYHATIGMGGRYDSVPMILFERLFMWTGNALLIEQLFIWIAFVLAIWYSVLTLEKIKTPRWISTSLLLFYSLHPMFQFILEMNSRDQWMSIISMILGVKFYQLLKSRSFNIKNYIIVLVLIFTDILLKETAWLLIPVLIVFLIRFYKSWIPIVSGAIVLIIVSQVGLQASAGYLKSTNVWSPDPAPVEQLSYIDPTNSETKVIENPLNFFIQSNSAIANVFIHPDSKITDEQRAYYEGANGGSSSWYQSYNPNLADQNGLPGDWNHFSAVCMNNLGYCLEGYFHLMQGFYLPKALDDSILRGYFNTDRPVGTYLMPYYVWERDNTVKDGDEMLNISKGSWLTDNLCYDPVSKTSMYPSDSSSTNYSFPITEDSIYQCFANRLPEQDAKNAFNSIKPYIRSTFFEKTWFPTIGPVIVNFWSDFAGGIFVDGFWYFWVLLVALILCIFRKNYRRLIGVVLLPVSLYAAYFYAAPTTYERYIFPMIAATPFIVAILVREWMISHKKFNPKRK